MPTDATTVFRFQIWVTPDGKTVGIFTPSIIGPDRVTDSLKKAAAKTPGAKVEVAGAAMPVVEDTGAQVTYTFGTVGAVRFAAPQSREVLLRVQSAVAEALIESGFGVSTE